MPLADTSRSSEVLGCWDFLASFSKVIGLEKFDVQELGFALERPGPSELLSEVHVRLLRTLLADGAELRRKYQEPPPPDKGLLLQQVPSEQTVSGANWPEVLRSVAWLLPSLLLDGAGAEATEAFAALQKTEDYSELPCPTKAMILKTLCDACLACAAVREALDANFAEMEEAEKEMRMQVAELKKRRREAAEAAEAEAKAELSVKKGMKYFSAVNAPTKTVVKAAAAEGKGEEGEGEAAAAAPAAEGGEGEGDAAPKGPKKKKQKVAADPEAVAALEEEKRVRAEATDALIAAIEARDEEALQSAIKAAESAGHMGTMDGKDGKGEVQWATDELRAACNVVAQMKRDEVWAAETEKLEAAEAEALKELVAKGNDRPTRTRRLGRTRAAAGIGVWARPGAAGVEAPRTRRRELPAAGRGALLRAPTSTDRSPRSDRAAALPPTDARRNRRGRAVAGAGRGA